MTKPVVLHVVLDHRLAVNGESLRTVVGGDFAVAVWAGRGLGGLMVIRNEPTSGRAADPGVGFSARRIEAFVRGLVDAGARPEGLKARIAGGADVLGFMPGSDRDARLEAQARALEAALTDQGLRPERAGTGGTMARTVLLDTTTGVCSVSFATRPPVAKRPKSEEWTVPIGALHIARSPDRLVASLGACVGIALYDPVAGIGGLAHAMLPYNPSPDRDPVRYSDTAVPALRIAMTGAGADPARLQAKLAGGARVLDARRQPDVFKDAEANVESARVALRQAGIPIVEEDVGGYVGRRISVDLETFRVSVRLVHSAAGGQR